MTILIKGEGWEEFGGDPKFSEQTIEMGLVSCLKEVAEYFLSLMGIFSYRDFVFYKVPEIGSKISVKGNRGKAVGTGGVVICSMINSVKSVKLVDFLSSVIAIQIA